MIHPKTLLVAHGLSPSRHRGQNFLVSETTANAIAEAVGAGEEDTVLEIGAGLGALTFALARKAGQVVAVEVDGGLVRVLRGLLKDEWVWNVQLLQADALRLNLGELAAKAGGKLIVAGNLPYSISSPLLVRLLEQREHWSKAVLMFQKEVVQRLVASPGSKAWGRLGILTQVLCEVSPGMVIGTRQFYPQPRVNSQLLTLLPRPRPLLPDGVDLKWFRQVIRAAFGQRRKALANALSAGLGLKRAVVEEALGRMGLSRGLRAEQLDLQQLGQLALELKRAKDDRANPDQRADNSGTP